MRLAAIQISLRARAVWSESSLVAFWISKDAKMLHTDNEDRWSDSAVALAVLSLRLATMSEGSSFSHVLSNVYVKAIALDMPLQKHTCSNILKTPPPP